MKIGRVDRGPETKSSADFERLVWFFATPRRFFGFKPKPIFLCEQCNFADIFLVYHFLMKKVMVFAGNGNL